MIAYLQIRRFDKWILGALRRNCDEGDGDEMDGWCFEIGGCLDGL